MGNITTLTGNVKNDQLFAEWAYDSFIRGNTKNIPYLRGAIQSFVNVPNKHKNIIIQAKQAKIQGFGVSTDFTKLPNNAFNLVMDTLNYDMGYEEAFKDVPLDMGTLEWTIYTGHNGITVHKVMEGGKLQVDEISGDHVNIECDYYGGALGFTDKMIRGRKVAAMIDRAEAFRNKLFTEKANVHYALIAAAAAGNITTYQGVAGDGELRRDIQTINQAAYTLTDRCKDKGYGDMANAGLIMYANPLRKNRILAAMAATTGNMAGVEGKAAQVNYTIKLIWTFNSALTNTNFILVVPKNKIQKSSAMAPTTYEAPLDVLTLNKVYATWEIYGAAIADTDQVQTGELG